MMKNLKKLLALSGAVVVAASLAACGGSSSYSPSKDYGYSGDYAENAAQVDWDYEAPEEAETSFSGSENIEHEKFVIESDQKLVYSCNISMETITFKESLSEIRSLVKKYEGFIEYESQEDSDYDWYYSTYRKTSGSLTENLTVRIPTANYDDFMAELEGNGKVRSKSQNVENITKAYANTETTIASLKIEEERLLEMMDQCVTIEEMITVEDRLSQVQNQLALYQSNLKSMDLDVAYSTVDIYLKEVLEYSPDVEPVHKTTFGERLINTIVDSWSSFTEFLEGFLFFMIYAAPVLLLLGAVFCAIFFPIRFSVKKRREKKAEAAQE